MKNTITKNDLQIVIQLAFSELLKEEEFVASITKKITPIVIKKLKEKKILDGKKEIPQGKKLILEK